MSGGFVDGDFIKHNLHHWETQIVNRTACKDWLGGNQDNVSKWVQHV
jgi:hypothetical protein